LVAWLDSGWASDGEKNPPVLPCSASLQGRSSRSSLAKNTQQLDNGNSDNNRLPWPRVACMMIIVLCDERETHFQAFCSCLLSSMFLEVFAAASGPITAPADSF
jgi:hypothetical protein